MSIRTRLPGAPGSRPRLWVATAVVLAIAWGCGGTATPQPPAPTPSPVPTATPVSAAPVPSGPLMSPSASASASAAAPTATPAASMAASHWEAAGSMTIPRVGTHAIALLDGRLLVIGNGGSGVGRGVRDDAAATDLWDPATGAWTATESLNLPRDEFAAIRLAGGGVLVTGGATQGKRGCESDDASRLSISSTFVYDPTPGHGTWDRVGLLVSARTAPAIAALPDGRVLVAGGYYKVAPSTGYAATLALAHPFADAIPETMGHALATAEIYDPATGTWSRTGSLRYARFGAAAVTLADGRVLVVGSEPGPDSGVSMVNDVAYDTAEIYDPKTGRFTLTAAFPAIDRAALAAGKTPVPDGDPAPANNGTLVALHDGGAVLVGSGWWWKHEGDITRSFRFDARSGAWTEIGQAWVDAWSNETGKEWTSPGDGRYLAMAVTMADGRVLVAGGDSGVQAVGGTARSAQFYDPATDTWSDAPSMPTGRAGGAALLLADGSVLVVGGYSDPENTTPSCDQPAGLRTAVRLVPGR